MVKKPSSLIALRRYLVLPREITSFETKHLQRLNRIALLFFWLHPPAFMVVATLCGTSVLLALMLSLGVLMGPTLAYFALASRPRELTYVYGLTAMIMAGVLVYIGRGPMQIEMHFYFFVLIALLGVFGNPLVILIASATVAAHHTLVWLVIPRGVFNYDASAWAVAVHALFVILEAVAGCFVARSFYDNVIALERIVLRRTHDLDERNRDMALILENVAQGFVTVDFAGSLGSQRSHQLKRWFGSPSEQTRIWTYLAGHDPSLEASMQVAFENLAKGMLPIDIAVGQLPHRLRRDDLEFKLEYRPLGEPATGLLVVISDITADLARERAELAQREVIGVVEKAYRDRAGFLAFVREADELVRSSVMVQDMPLEEIKRRVHTLKGSASLFGAQSVAAACHDLEDKMADSDATPTPSERAVLADAWHAFRHRIDRLLGISQRRTIIVDWEEYKSVLEALPQPEPAWATTLRRWGQDPTRAHLERFADQAVQLARRLGKPEIDVEILDNGLRLDMDGFAPLWSALIQAVRNAVAHGIEAREVRVKSDKPERGQLTLATVVIGAELNVVIIDDGAGIDWTRVAARAKELGLPAATPQDLQAALFATGAPTGDRVSETAGRGVGMSALRKTCVELGGDVEVTSEPGRGTTVRCRVPMVGPASRYRRSRHVDGISSAWR